MSLIPIPLQTKTVSTLFPILGFLNSSNVESTQSPLSGQIPSPSSKLLEAEKLFQPELPSSSFEGLRVNHSSPSSSPSSSSPPSSGHHHAVRSRMQTLSSSSHILDGDDSRFCSSPLECHLDMNERCVRSPSGGSFCGCREPFYRNSKSGICELKQPVQLVLRFNSIPFMEEFGKKNTPEFIKARELMEIILFEVIKSSTVLSELIKDIKILKFSGGSLQVTCLLLLVNPGLKSEEEHSSRARLRKDSLALLLVKEISVAAHDLNSTTRVPIGSSYNNPETSKAGNGSQDNSSSSSSSDNYSPGITKSFDFSITEIETNVNPCSFDDLNYCDERAKCVHFGAESFGGGFSCTCAESLTDHSPHPSYRGEICTIQCPENYCENNGHCHVDPVDSKLYCTCNNWNVGMRCQYSGIVVFSVLGVVMLLLLFVVGCTSAAFCGQRRIIATNTPVPIQPSSSSHSSRYTVGNKPIVTSCYEEHIRPFRITIDNPYEGLTNNITTASPSMTHVECPLHHHHSQPHQYEPNDRLPPRTSFEENDRNMPSLSFPHNLSNHTTPSPSPRPSISAAVETEGGNNSNTRPGNSVSTKPGITSTTSNGSSSERIPVTVPISVITPPTPEVALDKPARGGLKQVPTNTKKAM